MSWKTWHTLKNNWVPRTDYINMMVYLHHFIALLFHCAGLQLSTKMCVHMFYTDVWLKALSLGGRESTLMQSHIGVLCMLARCDTVYLIRLNRISHVFTVLSIWMHVTLGAPVTCASVLCLIQCNPPFTVSMFVRVCCHGVVLWIGPTLKTAKLREYNISDALSYSITLFTIKQGIWNTQTSQLYHDLIDGDLCKEENSYMTTNSMILPGLYFNISHYSNCKWNRTDCCSTYR